MLWGDVIFATIEADKEPTLCADFSVTALPTVLILREQFAVFYDTGLMRKSTLVDLVQQARSLNMAEVRLHLRMAAQNEG